MSGEIYKLDQVWKEVGGWTSFEKERVTDILSRVNLSHGLAIEIYKTAEKRPDFLTQEKDDRDYRIPVFGALVGKCFPDILLGNEIFHDLTDLGRYSENVYVEEVDFGHGGLGGSENATASKCKFKHGGFQSSHKGLSKKCTFRGLSNYASSDYSISLEDNFDGDSEDLWKGDFRLARWAKVAASDIKTLAEVKSGIFVLNKLGRVDDYDPKEVRILAVEYSGSNPNVVKITPSDLRYLDNSLKNLDVRTNREKLEKTLDNVLLFILSKNNIEPPILLRP